MTGKAKGPTRLRREILALARAMHANGTMDDDAFRKITLRQVKKTASPPPIKGAQIRALREKARMSQAVFAGHLNVTPGYVSQLERDAKQPRGSTHALLDVIRRKGIDAIL